MEGGGRESIVTCVVFFCVYAMHMLRVESASLANLNHYIHLLQSSQ